MRWGRFTFMFSAFIVFAVPALAADRVALVIGNGAYERVPALPNPPRDATDIANALERLDFKVTQLNNATAADMRKALVEFGRAAEGSMMAVVFYAGHGMEAGGENWLVPTDAELRSDTDIESEAVSLRSVNLQVSKARQLGLIILDACRNNPFAANMKRSLSTRGVARGLAPTEPTDNVLVAYAARDGTTANDGDGRNSPFTAALLRNIETPGLEISFLFRNVRDEVMLATKREQQPFVYGSLSKEAIYLRPPASAPAQETRAPIEVPASTEDERVWEVIRTSSDASLYEDFLKHYGYSPHAAEVRQRLVELKSTQVASVASPGARLTADQNAAGDIPRLLLAELRRVGCSRGINDGNWNIAAQRSLSLFNEKARTTFDVKFASLDALNAVRGKKDRVCPLICERGYKAKGDDCVEIVCKAGFKVGNDNMCEPNKVRGSNARRPELPRNETPTASTPPRTVGGSTMEDRYRACRKLVKGFARREACARTGSI
ncbi:Caspase domain-containing protein [Bradyrhizobium erythrophlei]|uniref:Caspase domain-containing protein n=2 Tax=Bradyrhizobium erythrophlei TaxID=1437360 RepID=A0A1M5X7V8_9BRAD|nr:Caspase domain-containing protein [Bradyrhizobium erythrophlei]